MRGGLLALLAAAAAELAPHTAAPRFIDDPERREELVRHLLARVAHALLPWSSFVIVPIFALANAGVVLSVDVIRDAVSAPVAIDSGDAQRQLERWVSATVAPG